MAKKDTLTECIENIFNALSELERLEGAELVSKADEYLRKFQEEKAQKEKAQKEKSTLVFKHGGVLDEAWANAYGKKETKH